MLYNISKFKERRQELRKNQTPHEEKLWKYLRARRMKKKRFFRQYSVGPYILDFYCPENRMAIELDGIHHEMEQKEYDKERDWYLQMHDVKVYRFTNKEIQENLTEVLKQIEMNLS